MSPSSHRRAAGAMVRMPSLTCSLRVLCCRRHEGAINLEAVNRRRQARRQGILPGVTSPAPRPWKAFGRRQVVRRTSGVLVHALAVGLGEGSYPDEAHIDHRKRHP